MPRDRDRSRERRGSNTKREDQQRNRDRSRDRHRNHDKDRDRDRDRDRDANGEDNYKSDRRDERHRRIVSDRHSNEIRQHQHEKLGDGLSAITLGSKPHTSGGASERHQTGKKEMDCFLEELKTKHITASGRPDIQRIRVEKPPRPLRIVIDVLAKYVARYGEHFEEAVKMDMNKDKHAMCDKLGLVQNIDFAFIDDTTQAPEAQYYRWRAFAYAQGDHGHHWRTDAFQMCTGGTIWQPPSLNRNESSRSCSRDGSPGSDDSQAHDRKKVPMRKGIAGSVRLGRGDRKDLGDLQRKLSDWRCHIWEAMVWCLDNADSATEIAKVLVDALVGEALDMNQRLCRLFLISDVAHNSGSTSASSAWCYRREFEMLLPMAFERLRNFYCAEENHVIADKAAKQVMKVLQSWQCRAVFTAQYVKGLETSLFKDFLSSEALAPSRGLARPATVAHLPDYIFVKLEEWRSQHFSQLEKLAKSRGLSWNTQDTMKSPNDQTLEEAKKVWLCDRLLTYEIYVWETRREEQAPRPEVIVNLRSSQVVLGAGGHGLLGPTPGGATSQAKHRNQDAMLPHCFIRAEFDDLDGEDMDGESLSSNDEDISKYRIESNCVPNCD